MPKVFSCTEWEEYEDVPNWDYIAWARQHLSCLVSTFYIIKCFHSPFSPCTLIHSLFHWSLETLMVGGKDRRDMFAVCFFLKHLNTSGFQYYWVVWEKTNPKST